MKFNTRAILTAAFLNIGIFATTGANAALVSALGGQVVNDTDLNIIWLANGNLAATETFGVNGIALDGTMSWQTAQLWIATMNTANYLGYNDWRLPTTTDTCTSGCIGSYSGTVLGYNNPNTSEMSHLYHTELGNKGYYDTSGVGPLAGMGLVNTGPFSNFQPGLYWSGTEYASDTGCVWDTGCAWDYGFDVGYQAFYSKNDLMFALAVRPGQIDTIPDPFSFTAQTGVALSSVATADPLLTVSGINSASAISIVGGTYSINGGTYVSTAGTITNGQMVTVQQTASGSYSTTTTATLTIGGVSGAFDVTTLAVPIDTIPTAFSFTAQTGVALSSVATSNTLTVSGINSASAISIVSGTYSINGGAYVSTAGTVTNGDTVTLQQTASGSYSTTTTTTLTIGGVGGAFNVTTLAAPVATTSYTALSATGSGSITASFTGGGAGCGYAISQYIPLVGHAASPPAGTAPAGTSFPHGLFDFTTSGCTVGATLTFTITYQQAPPPGTVYWKYGPTAGNISPHWYQLPAVITGNTVIFSITDGGLGDDDLTANGTIVDPGGPGVGGGAAAIPMLSEWALLGLAGLMGLFGMGAMQRRSAWRI